MKTIAIMVGNNQSEYIDALMKEFATQGDNRGVRIIFLLGYKVPTVCKEQLNNDYKDIRDYQFSSIYDYASYSGCDTCIVCYGSMSTVAGASTQEELVKLCQDIPTLMLETKPDYEDIPYLIVDGYKAIRNIMTHLIDNHGYKKIAFLAGPEGNYSSYMRLKAYGDAMAEAGLEVNEKLIGHGDYSSFVHKEIRRLLDVNEGLEAICCANDNMARACYDVCRERGLVVGKDIAITGFDDLDLSSKLDPPLTTVRHDAATFASLAIDMAVELADKGDVKSVEYPVDVIIRNSCGCEDVCDSNLNTLYKFSSLINDKNIDNYNITYDELKNIANNYAVDNQRLRAQAWLTSFFARDLIDTDIPADEYLNELFIRLKDVGLSNAYIFLHKDSVRYKVGDSLAQSKQMYFAGGFNEHNNIIIGEKEWRSHLVTSDKGFSQFIPGDGGNYHSYILFSGDEQYGVMLCKADVSDNEFMLYISLQISNLLRYFKLKKREEKAREEMKMSIDRIKESNQILSFISRYDELTKILNRRGFMEQALATIERRKGKNALILFADLDHLKEINDCFGHGDGDYAIITAAKLLTGLMPRDGFCARIGGDEFVAFIPVPRDESPEELINKLKGKLKEAMFLFNLTCDKPYFVELSAGFHSFVCEEGMDLTKIIASSDEVLYEDKQLRRNSIKKG